MRLKRPEEMALMRWKTFVIILTALCADVTLPMRAALHTEVIHALLYIRLLLRVVSYLHHIFLLIIRCSLQYIHFSDFSNISFPPKSLTKVLPNSLVFSISSLRLKNCRSVTRAPGSLLFQKTMWEHAHNVSLRYRDHSSLSFSSFS